MQQFKRIKPSGLIGVIVFQIDQDDLDDKLIPVKKHRKWPIFETLINAQDRQERQQLGTQMSQIFDMDQDDDLEEAVESPRQHVQPPPPPPQFDFNDTLKLSDTQLTGTQAGEDGILTMMFQPKRRKYQSRK